MLIGQRTMYNLLDPFDCKQHEVWLAPDHGALFYSKPTLMEVRVCLKNGREEVFTEPYYEMWSPLQVGLKAGQFARFNRDDGSGVMIAADEIACVKFKPLKTIRLWTEVGPGVEGAVYPPKTLAAMKVKPGEITQVGQ